MNLEGVNADWAEEFNGAVTVCDTKGIIVYMNQYSIKQFEKYGGASLLGTNLLDCHPEPSKSKLFRMLQNPEENMYTTDKDGVKKIIYQTPWRKSGVFAGIIEISFQLIPGMPNFIRE
jgi:transcriptional regulator with PAS, ATPase and Fis domain